MNLQGHLWTVWPTLADGLRPRPGPPSTAWNTTVHDPDRGAVTLRGALHVPPGSDTCVVLVHGLGGTVDAPYCKAAAHAASRLGVASLRFALRGADLRGQDFYHAGLVADLSAALASDALAGFSRLLIMGFSLGGHVTLRYALQPDDPRVAAVAAVCPPLDLARAAETVHAPKSRPYEVFILRALVQLYAQVAKNAPVPTPLARVRRVRSIREWDALTVVPRYGFDDVDDYYGRVSVGPRLGDLQLRSLILHSAADPMIPPEAYADFAHASDPARTTWAHTPMGGHVGFPAGVDLGLGLGRDAVEAQVVRWLLAAHG